MTPQDLILETYAAFNRRDIDAALAAMHDDVSWPKASEGGRAVGKRAIREYWTRQWSEFDPRVDVDGIVDGGDGTFEVRVHQLVKDRNGETLSDSEVLHTYAISDGLIERMDVGRDENGDRGPSEPFSRKPAR